MQLTQNLEEEDDDYEMKRPNTEVVHPSYQKKLGNIDDVESHSISSSGSEGSEKETKYLKLERQ